MYKDKETVNNSLYLCIHVSVRINKFLFNSSLYMTFSSQIKLWDSGWERFVLLIAKMVSSFLEVKEIQDGFGHLPQVWKSASLCEFSLLF